jgi:cellulose synthase operon protein C
MSTHLQQRACPRSSAVPLTTRATEALQLGKFKDAVQLFKQLLRQDSRPEWRDGLNDAYAGRARALAAKGMFEEAEIVLGNTLASDGTVREPLLYVQCLIRRGQQQKAAEHAIKYIGTGKISAAEASQLADLTAALCLAAPLRLESPADPESERSKWVEQAIAARQALSAWTEGKPQEQIESLLRQLGLRSAFKPLRVIIKALSTASYDPGRARQLLETVPSQSAFASFRFAVEAALPTQAECLSKWGQASKAQQLFVSQVNGWSEVASQCLAQLVKADRSGPGSLFSFLLKQTGRLASDELKAACFNLLPRIPDRLPQFEKIFGPLSALDKHRVLALAAEERTDWQNAERHWLAAAASLDPKRAESKLAAGVIYRHLARLARENQELEDSLFLHYLEKSLDVDPDHLPTVLDLLDVYRANHQAQNWARLADAAVRRFPKEGAVLLQAIDAALERQAYKKAAGFARKLLVLDPINQPARQRMIGLQISVARRQVRAKRPELAWNALAEAAEWERPDAPSFLLRINRGLLAARLDRGPEAEVQLRQGVQLAGGGVAGWFQAALENVLMGANETCAALLRQELVWAREAAPTKEAILTVAAASCSATGDSKQAIAELIFHIRGWLLKGSAIAWSAAEFHAIAQAFQHAGAFDLLAEYAKLASQRQPEDPTSRFYQVVARTRNDSGKLCVQESKELLDLAAKAAGRDDFHAAHRIWRFIDQSSGAPPRGGTQRIASSLLDFDVDDDLEQLLALSLQDTPPEMVRDLVASLGEGRAIKSLVNRLRKSLLGPIVPDDLIHDLAKVMVESAMPSRRPRP